MKSNINCGLWVGTMCQCKFVSANKGTILVGDLDNGEGYPYVRQGEGKKSLNFMLNFAVNLKVL